MCIVLLNLSHPDFLFVCGANRDEVLARPAAASCWHDFPPPSDFTTESSPSPSLALLKQRQKEQGDKTNGVGQSHAGPSRQSKVLSGIDAHPSGGGTWIGITREGRFGVLTNFTEYERPPLPEGRGLSDFRSRGALVKDWLQGSQPSDGHSAVGAELQDYLGDINAHSDEWPGFNVLAGYLVDARGRYAPRVGYVTNRETNKDGPLYIWGGRDQDDDRVTDTADATLSMTCAATSLGLSNSTFNSPWSKVTTGQQALDDALRRYDQVKMDSGRDTAERCLANDIFDILSTQSGPFTKREDLSGTVLVPPLVMPSGLWYATRVATVILVRRPASEAQSEEAGVRSQWWERDIFVLDAAGKQPARCGTEHERHYEWQLKGAQPGR